VWRKIIGSITHNLPLKLISILIAIVFWYIAIYYSDPKVTKSYTVRIEVTNESYIASGKQVYYIDDAFKTVTVYITDNSSKLSNINENYINVVADLTQIVDFNRNPVMVPLSASCAGISPANISLSRVAIPITIENVASKELPITISTGDTVPNKNYEIGSLTPDKTSITVTGAESIISQIDSVVAVINVTNMSANGERTATLQFIDKDQNAISRDQIEDDVTISGDGEVKVYVELWKKISGVKFDVNYSGNPAEGYRVSTITTSPDEITVSGNDDAIEALAKAGNTITIPADRVNVEGKSSDVVLDVVIADLLPENMKVAASMNDYVTVYVTILPEDSREFTVDVDNIELKNLGSNLSVSYSNTDVNVKVRATGSKPVSSLKASDISASIDLMGLRVGEQQVPVEITLPDGYELVEPVEITITLKEKTRDSTDAANDTTGGT